MLLGINSSTGVAPCCVRPCFRLGLETIRPLLSMFFWISLWAYLNLFVTKVKILEILQIIFVILCSLQLLWVLCSIKCRSGWERRDFLSLFSSSVNKFDCFCWSRVRQEPSCAVEEVCQRLAAASGDAAIQATKGGVHSNLICIHRLNRSQNPAHKSNKPLISQRALNRAETFRPVSPPTIRTKAKSTPGRAISLQATASNSNFAGMPPSRGRQK